jgi:hypothetical protein
MEAILDITVLFALVLILALLIERFFEIVKSIYDFFDSRLNWHHFWTERAKTLRDILEKKMNVFEYVDPKNAKAILVRFQELILNEDGEDSGNIPLISGDLVRAATIRTILKILAIMIGIWLAFRLKIDLITIWQNAQEEIRFTAGLPKIADYMEPKAYGIILTGIAIGLGSGPVHKIITAIERKREKHRKEGVKS